MELQSYGNTIAAEDLRIVNFFQQVIRSAFSTAGREVAKHFNNHQFRYSLFCSGILNLNFVHTPECVRTKCTKCTKNA